MRKKKPNSISLRDLKDELCFDRVHEVFTKTGKPAPVVNGHGDTLCGMVSETEWQDDPTNPAVRVPVDVFCDHRTRFAYWPTAGHIIFIERPQGSFVLLPPLKTRGDITPTSLNCWWASGRRSSPNSDREPGDSVRLVTVLMQLVAKVAAVELRLDKLGVRRARKRRQVRNAKPAPETAQG